MAFEIVSRIERLPSVLGRVGMGRAWVYSAMQRGAFPRQVKLGERAVGWRSNEVDAWIVAREKSGLTQ